MLPVESPFKTYTGLDGKPLNNGYVYFGLPNQNPITAPVTVYLDSAGTIPAAQPLRTVNGYLVAVSGGSPVNVFITGSYSEVVRDSKKRQVFYAPNSDDFSVATAVTSAIAGFGNDNGSLGIGFIQDGLGAVPSNLQKKARERKSVADRGGNGTSDATVAIQNALDVGYGYIGPELYSVSAPLVIPAMSRFEGAKPGISFIGDTHKAYSAIKKTNNSLVNVVNFETGIGSMQDAVTVINPTWPGDVNFRAYPQKVTIHAVAFQGNAATPNSHGLFIEQASGIAIRDVQYSDVINAIYAKNVFASVFENIQASAKFVVKSGTSMTWTNVGSGSGNGSDGGFNIESAIYSSWIGSWVDGAKDTAWRVVNSKIAMISTGTETSTTRTADSGTSLAIDGNSEVVLINHATVPMANQVLPIATLGEANVVTEIHGCSDFGVAGVNCDDLYLAGSNSHWHYWEHKFVNGSRNNPIIQAKTGVVNARAYVWFEDNCKVYSSDGAGGVISEAHYDAGSWAPILRAGTDQIVGGTRTGTWQKNRKLVTLNGRIAVPDKGASAGLINITGWPTGFVPLGDVCVNFAYSTGFTGGPISAIIDIGSTQMNLLLKGATGDVNMSNTSMVNGFTAYFSVTFTIA